VRDFDAQEAKQHHLAVVVGKCFFELFLVSLTKSMLPFRYVRPAKVTIALSIPRKKGTEKMAYP